MSHFTVAVFTDGEDTSIDDILEPFYEGNECEPYVSMTKAEIVQRERDTMKLIYRNQYAEWQKDPEEFEKTATPEHIKQLRALPRTMRRTDEQIYKDQIKMYDETEISEDGEILSTYNPDSKWDWFEVGGRWHGMLILKDGCIGERGSPSYGSKLSENYDAAWVKDIDFVAMMEKLMDNLPPYAEALEQSMMKPEYFKEMYPTEDDYIKQQASFSTYAVVTPDGEWYEPGEMGWWGMSSASADEKREWNGYYYDSFIKPAIENGWYVTIVDCHI